MDAEKVIEVAKQLFATIVNTESALVPIRNNEGTTRRDRLQHLLWMCVQIAEYILAGRLEKAMRWLGFVQGATWAMGIVSVEDSKRANMPADEAYDPNNGVKP